VKVNYLSADVRLSKTFEEIAPGNIKETSYPHVVKFSSVERNVNDLDSFYGYTVAASAEGMCLLKGLLDQPLVAESRAGHTDASQTTEWLCLDVDYTVIDHTPGEFLDSLDTSFVGVDYVFQCSASMGIKSHEGWRGHFFVLLSGSYSPQQLKQWLLAINLRCPHLRAHLELSAGGGALRYPLDITTCQNDKLIFIAEPTLINVPELAGERWQLVKRAKRRANLDLSTVSAAHNAKEVQAKLVELRDNIGLPKKTFKTTRYEGCDVLTNPDPVTVTGKKEARGFVYLNLNGGDSWAYYFPISNSEVLFNFKGQPCMYMQDVDKEILNEYIAKQQTTEGSIPFGFLWPVDDVYYRGFANPQTQELSWLRPTGQKTKLRDFFVQHGVKLPTGWAVPEWQLEFDPSRESYADFTKQVVNTYQKSSYLKEAKRKTDTSIPPTIDKVICSVCVEDEVKDYFLNWLAYIFQTRGKTTTAWIFQGVQGTGKGVLLTQVIAPLLGRKYCHEMTMDRLDDDFNAYLSENIILFIDEAKVSDSKNGDRLLNRIKNLVTEPEQHIRGMRQNSVIRQNYSNIILASNYDDIIALESTDRRFNVAPRQETPIQLDYEDISRIAVELPDFADYLHSYEVNHQNVRQVLLTEARERLIKLSETTIDAFFKAIRHGDLSYFTQYIDNSTKMDVDGIRYHDYALTVKRWVSGANKPMNVNRSELRTVYQYLQHVTISTSKFSRMVQRYNLDVKPIRVENQVVRGLYGHVWHLAEDELEMFAEALTDKVVQLRS